MPEAGELLPGAGEEARAEEAQAHPPAVTRPLLSVCHMPGLYRGTGVLPPMNPTHAISVRQPWADNLFRRKTFENRTWHLPEEFRGVPVYLHAGKKHDLSPPHWVPGAVGDKYWQRDERRYGAILGVIQFDHCVHPPGPPDLWWTGPHGWHVEWSVAFPKPIPYRGRLGFFRVTITQPPAWGDLCKKR